MFERFDPRLWNICAGLTLVASCGGRTIGGEGGEVGESETTASTGPSTSVSTTQPPECVTSNDCDDWEECIDGICEYIPHHDGHIPYYYEECLQDVDCDELQLCYRFYCEPVEEIEYCDDGGEPIVPYAVLAIPEQALALTFADLDDDLDEELVVAGPTQLHVYPSELGDPVSSPRGEPGEGPVVLAAGRFDDMPGDEVELLHADILWQHSSGGTLSFGAASSRPSPILGSSGLLADDFGGDDGDELLVWGSLGAVLELGGGLELSHGPQVAASHLATPGAELGGIGLIGVPSLVFYDLAADVIHSDEVRGHEPLLIADLGDLGAQLTTSNISTWTVLEAWTQPASEPQRWGVVGVLSALETGDLDGNLSEDLVGIRDDRLFVVSNFSGDPCWQGRQDLGEPHPIVAIALGDHDGDGNQDIAALTTNNEVLLYDF